TGETDLFSRAEPPKDRALPGAVMVAALQTPVGQVSEPVRAGAAIYVVKTLERQPADQAGFDKKREELQTQLLEQKRNQAWDNWVQSRRRPAKIETNLPASAGLRKVASPGSARCRKRDEGWPFSARR